LHIILKKYLYLHNYYVYIIIIHTFLENTITDFMNEVKDMGEESLESIVDSLLSILPLFKKKLIKPGTCSDEDGLSPTHYQILFLLDDLGMLSVSEIAKNLYVSKPNMTPLIKKMIDRGLVERSRNEEDRRYVNINLTQDGRDFVERHKKFILNSLKERLAKLGENELENLSKSLQNVREIISKL
jgi:DNA-binding MarR family transcriptional regulator